MKQTQFKQSLATSVLLILLSTAGLAPGGFSQDTHFYPPLSEPISKCYSIPVERTDPLPGELSIPTFLYDVPYTTEGRFYEPIDMEIPEGASYRRKIGNKKKNQKYHLVELIGFDFENNWLQVNYSIAPETTYVIESSTLRYWVPVLTEVSGGAPNFQITLKKGSHILNWGDRKMVPRHTLPQEMTVKVIGCDDIYVFIQLPLEYYKEHEKDLLMPKLDKKGRPREGLDSTVNRPYVTIHNIVDRQ